MIEVHAADVVAIVVALVAAGGGAALITGFSSLFYAPFMIITIDGEDISNSALITITNEGTAPATNMILTISAPAHISSLQKKTDSIGAEMPSETDTKSAWQVRVPKFMNGPGSILALQSSTESNVAITSYTIYATYDQGSAIYESGLSSPPPPVYFGYNPLYLFLPLLVVGEAVAIILIKRRSKIRSIEDFLRNNLIKARYILTDDKKKCSEKIPDEDAWSKLSNPTKRIFLIKDYLAIDDLYRQIQVRNLLLDKNEDKNKSLEESNEKCLRLLDEVLLNIDWATYTTTRVRPSKPEKEPDKKASSIRA